MLTYSTMSALPHRIGDLEKWVRLVPGVQMLPHRIGDLEIKQVKHKEPT